MKKITLLFVLTCISFSIFCQEYSTNVQDYRVPVTIKLSKKKSETGMTEIFPYAPWEHQKSISVFDESMKDDKWIKKKHRTKYKAKDVLGFEADGKTFVSKKVLLATVAERTNTKMLPSYYFLEQVLVGKINVYKGYSQMPLVNETEEMREESRNTPQYFLEKDKKIKNSEFANLEKWLKDGKETYEKYMDGGFGNTKRKKSKKKLMSRLTDGLSKFNEKGNRDMLVKIITAYNIEMEQ